MDFFPCRNDSAGKEVKNFKDHPTTAQLENLPPIIEITKKNNVDSSFHLIIVNLRGFRT